MSGEQQFPDLPALSVDDVDDLYETFQPRDRRVLLGVLGGAFAAEVLLPMGFVLAHLAGHVF